MMQNKSKSLNIFVSREPELPKKNQKRKRANTKKDVKKKPENQKARRGTPITRERYADVP